MMNTLFKLPLLTGLGLVATGIMAKTAVAAEKLALKEVAPSMQQALGKDTLTLLPQAEKALDNAGSVLLPNTVAHWNGYRHHHPHQYPQYQQQSNSVEAFQCIGSKHVTYPYPHNPHQTWTGTVRTVLNTDTSAPAPYYTQMQRQGAAQDCHAKGGNIHFFRTTAH